MNLKGLGKFPETIWRGFWNHSEIAICRDKGIKALICFDFLLLELGFMLPLSSE
jgi:hypothetical protein